MLFVVVIQDGDLSFPRTLVKKVWSRRHPQVWSEEAILDIIRLWGEYYHKYKGSIPNEAYEHMSQSLKLVGHNYTDLQCKNRINSLLCLYKKVCH